MDRSLDALFAALADPTRRRILTLLLEDDMAVTDVAAPFAMSLAAVSKHLRVLAAAGLIVQERRGRVTWCALEPEGLRAAAAWMQSLGQLDVLDIEALDRALVRLGLQDETDDREDDDHEADEIDDLVHGDLRPVVRQ